MKTKRIEIHTVMSWNNTWGKETIRAIALCDAYKWFDAAINCLRDGDMGEKDENGVYSRIWWADEAGSCCDDSDLRPATPDEVALYRQYCPWEFADSTDDYYGFRTRVLGETTDCYGTHVIKEHLQPSRWYRFRYALRRLFRKSSNDMPLPF